MTVRGARALCLHDRGRPASGQLADFVVWDAGHPCEPASWSGREPPARIVAGGKDVLR